jgi:hypothetical protein
MRQQRRIGEGSRINEHQAEFHHRRITSSIESSRLLYRREIADEKKTAVEK